MNSAESTEELSDDNDVAEFYRISKFCVNNSHYLNWLCLHCKLLHLCNPFKV